MHLISPLISGVRGAENGSARVVRRGTATRATLYSSFEGDSFASSSLDNDNDVILDSYGRAEVYVDEVCDVTVYDEDGTQQIVFTAGYAASAIEVRSASFTGSAYDGSGTGTSEPVNLQEILDLWNTVHSDVDWEQSFVAALPVYNPKDPEYGAVGDGATDDTAAVQAALTAAYDAGGGLVYFPAGTYIVSAALDARNVSLVGPSNATLQLNHATADLLETQNVQIYGLTLNANASSGAAVAVTTRTTISNATLYSGGPVVEIGETMCTLLDSTLESAGDTVLACLGTVSTSVTRCARCRFIAPEEYSPSDDAMVFGNNMHFDECVFSASVTQVGTFSYLKWNGVACVGTVRACTFETPNAATVTAITLGAYGAGTRFFESNNNFRPDVTAYSYTSSASSEDVHLMTRESLTKEVSDNGASIAIPTDQFGIIIVKSTHASPVLTGTLPPNGARGTVLFYHPSGGAGTAQPTTNFFGATAATTANTSTHGWDYVCAKVNTALRMLVLVDGKALGNGAP